MCIRTPNTGQLNHLYHTFAEFRPIVNSVVVRQPTDWLAANAQLSPDERKLRYDSGIAKYNSDLRLGLEFDCKEQALLDRRARLIHFNAFRNFRRRDFDMNRTNIFEGEEQKFHNALAF